MERHARGSWKEADREERRIGNEELRRRELGLKEFWGRLGFSGGTI